MILAERSVILAVLIASGVPARDRADVEQDIPRSSSRAAGRHRAVLGGVPVLT
ncbi:hypothetical protein WMF04_20200 [Sorangium sp. So ce260]|uniref:hypothetical protein n=1 Tax=Sorangium sp. So ce260 TaxID=3133291 RepID=UPI003F6018D7